ncbi:hypothetical protein H5392_08525 [Tessaracoccus sp. MC1865]|uniref:sensor histidine kinase n=2 Tax=Tessaracoccus sp. MC1865 TaxID=2760310 RepID=UPI0015FFBF39|nr:ATP-binding protein [Tessaracoccus sp. MC1865]MBB1483901.1 hypothetical protein [Tessaracoccus sp. MC1865]
MALETTEPPDVHRRQGRPQEVLRPWPRGGGASRERPVEVAVAVIAILGMPKLVGGISQDDPTYLLTGLGVLFVAHVLVAIDCLWIRRLGWLIVGLTVVATGIIVVGQLLEGPAVPGHWRTDAWFGTLLTYGILLRGRKPQLLVLSGSFVIGLAVVVTTQQLEWVPQIRSLAYTLSGLGVLVVARLITIAITEEYLASRQLRAEQEQDAGESAARAEALAGLRREMHDSLLHALQRMGASWSAANADEVRASCEEARQRLAQMPEPLTDDKPVDVCAMLHRSLKPRRQVITCEPETLLVPLSVAQALVGAAREAVRNALEHTSGIPEVHLVQRGGTVRVTVSDEGPGFDVTAPRGQSLGLEGSVVQRMAAIGGEAHVQSAAGGTTVEMQWPASPPEPGGLGERARRLISWCPIPLVAASALHILTLEWPGAAFPMAITLIVAALIAVGAVAVRGGGLAPWQSAVLCGVGMITFIVNYAAVQGAPSIDWDLWAPSLVSALLIIGLPGQPVRVAVPLAGVVVVGAVTTSWLTLGWQATIGSHFGGLLAVLLYTIVTLVLVFGAQTVSRHLHVTRRLAAAAELRAHAAQVRDGVWHAWLARAERLTGAFLGEVADGSRDPFAPETRAQAARLGARMRDELRLWPGPLRLASELDRLRGAGWDARLLTGDVGSTSDDLAELLGHLGRPGEEHAQLLVSAEDGTATVTATPAVAMAEHSPLRRWVSIADPDFTQFRTGKES